MLARQSIRSSLIAVAAQRGIATSAVSRAGEAGHTARAQGFNKREKAEEEKYILEKEREKYRKAHAALEQQKKDLEKMEKDHADSDAASKKQ